MYTEAIKLNGKVATYYSNRAAAFLELTRYNIFPSCNFLSSLSIREMALSVCHFLEELTCMGVFFPPWLLIFIRFEHFSYRQAEADCTSAIDIDPKVRICFLVSTLKYVVPITFIFTFYATSFLNVSLDNEMKMVY